MSARENESAQRPDTRQRLIEATMETIRTVGITKVSARTIAATGDLNQALVFYHFKSVDNLIGEACMTTTAASVAAFAARFDAVSTLTELVELARELQQAERAAGNTTVLAQVLAAAHSSPRLAELAGAALRLRVDQVETALARVLSGSPFAELLDAPALARIVSATFIGLDQMEQVGLGPAASEGTSLEQLERLARTLDGLGPITRRAVRSSLRPRG